MPDKTKTVVVIERHEQTIIRRSRRTVSGQVLTQGAVLRPDGVAIAAEPGTVARPSGRAPSDVMEPAVQEKPKSALKFVTRIILKPLRNLCVLCVSVVKHSRKDTDHRVAENTEQAQRTINRAATL